MSSNIPSTTLDDVNVTAPANNATIAPTTAGYAHRQIQATFQLGTGNFGNTSSNQLTTPLGLRMQVQIAQAHLPTAGRAVIRIFGLTLSQINTLTKAGLQFYLARNNKIALQAGDTTSGLSTIFNGNIYEAWPDFESQPDTSLVIVAVDQGPTGTIQLKPVAPVSFPGAVPVATALQQILQPAGLTLENNGVNATLQSPYFQGTAWQQAQQAIKAADCFGYLDGMRGILAIWPKTGARSGTSLLISPATGMIAYPRFSQNYLMVRTLFNPGLKGVGLPITVQSQLSAANGQWYVDNIDYNLACETPNGPWEMSIRAHSSQLPG